MDNSLFSHISGDYYTRCYKLNPTQFDNLSVTVFALCAQNVERINNEYYWLDLYYSISNIGTLDYLIGVSFGESQMDQKFVDAEIDDMVEYMITEPGFSAILQQYLKRERIVEATLTQEAMDQANAPDDNAL